MSIEKPISTSQRPMTLRDRHPALSSCRPALRGGAIRLSRRPRPRSSIGYVDEHPQDGLLAWHRTEVSGRVASYGVGGNGPPVVFLHGWGLSGRTYRAALKRLLARGLQVWAPALPGFGGSAALPDDATLADYAAWVDAFCAAVGITRPVVLMGHSFGGGVAIQTAHDFPARARALVLINSIGGSAWRPHGSMVQSLAERPLWDWGLHLPRDVLPLRQLRRVLPVIIGAAVPNALRNPRAFLHAANVARYADLTAELDELKTRRLPTVVLWGDRDEIVTRASFDAMCTALGGPLSVTVEGSHTWMLADPDGFGEVITNVLAIALGAQAEEHEPKAHELATLAPRRAHDAA
jgi:pimeloyl-ACP methyl ester carboxylesterase